MKLVILGSGGGEGYPAVFCNCEHCKQALKEGGKNLRSLSQSLIDDKILIDLPADTHMHVIQHRMTLQKIEHLLITHSHADHYVPVIMELRGGCFAHDMESKSFSIYGNSDIKRLFYESDKVFSLMDCVKKNIHFPTVKAYTPFKIDNYTITAIHAMHAPNEEAFNYIIDDGKTSLLYLVDTGYPSEEVFNYLATIKKPFGCVAMDSTLGVGPDTWEYHMCFQDNIKLKKKLESMGLTSPSTRFVIMHITHNQAPLHNDIVKYFEGTGIEVSYDGMELEF